MTLRWLIICENRTSVNRESGWVKRRLRESFETLIPHFVNEQFGDVNLWKMSVACVIFQKGRSLRGGMDGWWVSPPSVASNVVEIYGVQKKT